MTFYRTTTYRFNDCQVLDFLASVAKSLYHRRWKSRSEMSSKQLDHPDLMNQSQRRGGLHFSILTNRENRRFPLRNYQGYERAEVSLEGIKCKRIIHVGSSLLRGLVPGIRIYRLREYLAMIAAGSPQLSHLLAKYVQVI